MMKIKSTEPSTKYRLIIGCNSWVGNFERELIGYSTGLMSIDMMEISNPGEYCTDYFFKEVLNKEPEEFISCDDTELGQYFVSSAQDFGEFAGYSFYNILNGSMVENAKSDSYIVIQLIELLDAENEELLLSRIKKFFELNPDNCLNGKAVKITELFLEDISDNVIKYYL